MRSSLVLLAALIAVAGCSTGSGAGGSDPVGPSASSPHDPGEPGTGTGASLPASIIDPIVADAAAGLGVNPSALKVVSAEARTYGDGSLGCPRPGEMYTQAIVDGYQVIVEANGTQRDYRGSGPGRFRICEDP